MAAVSSTRTANVNSLKKITRKKIQIIHTYLPDTHNGIGDENQKNDKWFHKRSCLLISLLKPSQELSQVTEISRSTDHEQLENSPPKISDTALPHRPWQHQINTSTVVETKLTNEMTAARRRIFTSKSSNCSKTSLQRDFPKIHEKSWVSHSIVGTVYRRKASDHLPSSAGNSVETENGRKNIV